MIKFKLSRGFPGSSDDVQETQVGSLGQEDPMEKGMTTHSSMLAWRILWTEMPVRLQSLELQRVRHNWALNTFQIIYIVIHAFGMLSNNPLPNQKSSGLTSMFLSKNFMVFILNLGYWLNFG